MAIVKLTQDDAKWQRFGDHDIFLGDVVDDSRSRTMGVGYARYRAGERNEWTVDYDEALIVISGHFTVDAPDGSTSVTAGPGEIIWLDAKTPVVYTAEDAVVLAWVTYPVWSLTEGTKEQADVLQSVDSEAPTVTAG
jgi:ethanolamine utilization protein EutQ (cupin superfamily)